MNIRIYLITSDSEFNRLNNNWTVSECLTSACRDVSGAVGTLVAEGVYAKGFSNNIIAYGYSVFKTDAPAAVTKWDLKSEPIVLFYDEDNKNLLSFLKSNQISQSAIITRYKALTQYTHGSQDGMEGYYDPNGKFHLLSSFVERSLGLPFGFSFPLFDFSDLLDKLKLKIPEWLWLVASCYCGFKVIESDKKISKWVYGGLGGVSFINYMNAKEKSTQ